MKTRKLMLLTCLAISLAGCQREERNTRPDPMLGEGEQPVAVTTLAPGGEPPQPVSDEKGAEFKGSAYHVSEGKRLFSWFNCTGCHSNGGGGMGPALMDDKWLYGGSIESIHASIRDGRPNGMPSFRDMVPDDQLWELAAYVLSMSGNVRSDVAPSRNDDMMAKPSENRMPNATTQGKTP